jgi:hypothetical protein
LEKLNPKEKKRRKLDTWSLEPAKKWRRVKEDREMGVLVIKDFDQWCERNLRTQSIFNCLKWASLRAY